MSFSGFSSRRNPQGQTGQGRTSQSSQNPAGGPPNPPPAGQAPSPVTRRPSWYLARRAEEEYWSRLRTHIRNVVDDQADAELQNNLQQHLYNIPEDMRPSDERILHDGAHFLNIANQRLEPRLAVIFLAQAGWNYDMAVREYIEQRYSDDEPSLEVGDTAAIPEPEGEASEDERRGEEEEGPDDESEGPQSLATLNQDIDRGHVIKDRRDDSKLVIRIKNLGGLPDSIHKYGKKPRDVDWSDPAAIRAINRWRSQLFRRTLQSNVRGERFSFLEEERRFLLDAHIEYQEKSLAAGAKNVDWKKFDWTRLTKEFNQKFKGQILPTSSKPRPARTKASLLTERSRLEEITDMTGGFKRKDRKAPKAQRPRSVHESDEEDSEEETQGPNRGRRGDPPPGKPPRRRKDGDDDGAGGAGLASSVGRRRELQV